jgi:hypothetical protein
MGAWLHDVEPVSTPLYIQKFKLMVKFLNGPVHIFKLATGDAPLMKDTDSIDQFAEVFPV